VALTVGLSCCSTACEDAGQNDASQAGDASDGPTFTIETTRVGLPDLRLASATAFAFASRSDGATLVWAPPGEKTTIRGLRLSRGGNPLGGTALVAQAGVEGGVVTDLVATPAADGLAVAWVQRLANEARLQAALKEESRSAAVFDLGPAWHTQKTVRGNVAVAADGDHALVFARGQSEPCVSPGERECFAFGLHRIGSTASRPRGLPLSVPVPCERNSVQLSVSGGRWFYGVCTAAEGKRVTTLFDIQLNPEYARAQTLLPGCQPLGIVARGSTPWLVGLCKEKRLGVELGKNATEPVELGTLELRCVGRKLALGLDGPSEPLPAGRTDLGPLLPARVLGGLQQAVYTGSSLLVAHSEGGSLQLVRHACVAGGPAKSE
jgi:hypothetical protein